MAFSSSEVLNVNSATVAKVLNPALYSGANTWVAKALVSVESAPIRITLDGTAPNNTTKNGLYLNSGAIIEVIGERDMANFKAVMAEASAASVSVMYQQED